MIGLGDLTKCLEALGLRLGRELSSSQRMLNALLYPVWPAVCFTWVVIILWASLKWLWHLAHVLHFLAEHSNLLPLCYILGTLVDMKWKSWWDAYPQFCWLHSMQLWLWLAWNNRWAPWLAGSDWMGGVESFCFLQSLRELASSRLHKVVRIAQLVTLCPKVAFLMGLCQIFRHWG